MLSKQEAFNMYESFKIKAEEADNESDFNRLSKMVEVYKAKAGKLALSDIEARRARLEARVSKIYGSFDEWYKWAQSMYIINNEFKVISKALNWTEEMSWESPDEQTALEKVEQLIRWKHYNHFLRNTLQS